MRVALVALLVISVAFSGCVIESKGGSNRTTETITFAIQRCDKALYDETGQEMYYKIRGCSVPVWRENVTADQEVTIPMLNVTDGIFIEVTMQADIGDLGIAFSHPDGGFSESFIGPAPRSGPLAATGSLPVLPYVYQWQGSVCGPANGTLSLDLTDRIQPVEVRVVRFDRLDPVAPPSTCNGYWDDNY